MGYPYPNFCLCASLGPYQSSLDREDPVRIPLKGL